ncbi:hypothetical protein D3C79_526000 [compost metagenome]
MGLVDDEQAIPRQVVKQGGRRLAGGTPRQIAAVVLDTGAVPQLLHHLDVELGTLADALFLHQLVEREQLLAAPLELFLDVIDGSQNGLARRGVVGLGVDGVAHHRLLDGAGQGIELGEPLHLLVEQLHPQCQLVRFGRVDVDHLPPHPEGAALEGHVVAGVLQLGEAAQYVPLVDHIPDLEMQHHAEVGLGVPQTIDGRYRGDDHHVSPLQ